MNAFHSKHELSIGLSSMESTLVLSVFPEGARIAASHYFDNYNLPCPIKVKIDTPNGTSQYVVLRKTRHGDVEREENALRLLSQYGLPVPIVLAGPCESRLVLSLLEGENLQHFSMRSKGHLEKSKALLITALSTLDKVTGDIERETTPDIVPRHSLMDELAAIKDQSPWNSEGLFRKAVDVLQPILEKITTPLVFTNGDYQPANFLTDGAKITGFVDFEKACFRDPLMGIAKYPVYDLHPLNKAGFVDSYLDTREYDRTDFASRLALMCLITLQREIPVRTTSEGEQTYLTHVTHLLKEAMTTIV
jgi:aminoglycoside phosphotransferase